jgi:hypothetical protein
MTVSSSTNVKPLHVRRWAQASLLFVNHAMCSTRDADWEGPSPAVVKEGEDSTTAAP